jgi:hypothetical protein
LALSRVLQGRLTIVVLSQGNSKSRSKASSDNIDAIWKYLVRPTAPMALCVCLGTFFCPFIRSRADHSIALLLGISHEKLSSVLLKDADGDGAVSTAELKEWIADEKWLQNSEFKLQQAVR